MRNLKRTLALLLVVFCCSMRVFSVDPDPWLVPPHDDNILVASEEHTSNGNRKKKLPKRPDPVNRPRYHNREHDHIIPLDQKGFKANL